MWGCEIILHGAVVAAGVGVGVNAGMPGKLVRAREPLGATGKSTCMVLFAHVSANVLGLVLQTVERLIAHWALVGSRKLGLCWGDRSSRSGRASSNRALHCLENKSDDKENKKVKTKVEPFAFADCFLGFAIQMGWDGYVGKYKKTRAEKQVRRRSKEIDRPNQISRTD
jgi:hypothetical protein